MNCTLGRAMSPNDGNGDIEEEVLATKACVVWSQGKLIRNVYRFELEGEDVSQALLTTFSVNRQSFDQDEGTNQSNRITNLALSGRPNSGLTPPMRDGKAAELRNTSERALVVLLKSKAHVYFLHGTSHIVDLPFEILKAFPAPQGVLLQRKRTPSPSPPATPQVPAAPPNSFFSSQLRQTASYLQSPTLVKSFASTQPSRPSPLSGKSRLGSLSLDAFGGLGSAADDETAAIYSLTDPLSDLGVVTYSIQQPKPRLSKASAGLSVDFEAIDNGERIVYVSPQNELAGARGSQSQLVLIVTVNQDLHTLTIWHAWYVEERSLASLLKQRAAHKAAMARRRSSFMSSMGTGATTPAVRPREGMRDSLAGATSMRQPGDPAPSQPRGASSRRPTRQEEEEAMASQMDPEYQPGASQQAVRDSRRISSLNTDLRQSQYNPNASFAGPGGRRNASFGGPGERRSFGHRKSRGSTPGSVFSRSLGPEDDLMDLDGSFDADDEESLASIIKHIRATFEAAGAESILAGLADDMKRELLVRKLHSIPLSTAGAAPSEPVHQVQVATLLDQHSRGESEDSRLTVVIHQRHAKDVIALQLLVKHRFLWPELLGTPKIAIPLLTGETKLGPSSSILKLINGDRRCILLANRGLVFGVDNVAPWPLSSDVPYRAYDRRDQSTLRISPNRDVGRNRTLTHPPREQIQFCHPGIDGRFNEIGLDFVHHRRQIRFSPQDTTVNRALEVCELILPAEQARTMRVIWCIAHAELVKHSEKMTGTLCSVEWVAFVTALCTYLMHLLHDKSRASLMLTDVATGQGAIPSKPPQRLLDHQRSLLSSTTVDWVQFEASCTQVWQCSNCSDRTITRQAHDHWSYPCREAARLVPVTHVCEVCLPAVTRTDLQTTSWTPHSTRRV